MSRVIAVGLDAVDPSRIDDLVRAGRLPHLARLRERAATVELRAADDFRAESPWNEFANGRRAASMRYWTTVTFAPDEYDAYMRGAPDTEPFYALGEGTTVVTLDVPKVIRSPNVHGVQVLGWGAHSPQYPLGSTPDEVLPALLAQFGPHPGVPFEYAGGWNQPAYLAHYTDTQARAVVRRAEILEWLARRTPDWDLLVTLVGETHQVGHLTSHGFGGRYGETRTAPVARRGLTTVLQGVDDFVGQVVGWAPPDTTVVVFSVQGMSPTEADGDIPASLLPEVLLRSIAQEARLPRADLSDWRRRGGPPVVPSTWESPLAWTLRQFPNQSGPSRVASARTYAQHVMRHHAPGVVRASHRLRRRGADATADQHDGDERTFPLHDHTMDYWHVAAWYRDAWPRLPAFVLPGYLDAHVRINLVGRERDGIVERDDYARACDEIEQLLRACRNGATGAPIVRDVHRIRESDPFDPEGPPPDLVVHLDGADAIEHPDAGAVGPFVATRTGAHTSNGFAYLAGPSITPGPRGRFAVCDLSATLTALVGGTPVAALDGEPFLPRSAVDSVTSG